MSKKAETVVISKGAALVLDLMMWFRGYVAVSEGQALVAILWALHTWIFERFTSTPYLQIAASTKQAGKTLCMDVIGLLCRHYHGMATVRVMAICRLIEAYDGQITFGIDEAERLASNAVGDTRSMLATGYRKGATHAVTAGAKVQEYRTYCPKMFALIGDMVGVLRDRSIQLDLVRGIPERDLNANYDDASMEATSFVARWKDDVSPSLTFQIVTPDHLTGRDREIWTPLFSLATMLGLSSTMMDLLVATSVDMTAAKSRPARSNHSFAEEKGAEDRQAADRVLADLLGVCKGAYVSSADAVDGLKALPSAPWRTWRKVTGLDQIALASLLRVHGVRAVSIQVPKTRTVIRGYKRLHLEAAQNVSKG